MEDLYEAQRTVASAPHDLLKIIILERRKFFIDAFERYNRNKYSNRNSAPELARLRAEMYSLFLELQAALRRDLGQKTMEDFPGNANSKEEKTEAYAWLRDKVKSKDTEDLEAAYFFLNDWLDDKKFIRIDTKRQYDRTRVETENREKSL